MYTCPHQVSEPPLDLISDDGAADCLADDESHQRGQIPLTKSEMYDKRRASGAASPTNRLGELVTPPHAGSGR
ncbi:hypothetical protein Aph01nite_15240 [Acrocarpospora phusangensis]|uniref:Uncharacterized protein n=1 Tax=Acrocarpospora phusangensis TaxID=1070424 RepID=A0A919Q8L8_9ACTN|nr:hypothetical protein Aph01nite_15240 [Acrocarpospora phusangensis]